MLIQKQSLQTRQLHFDGYSVKFAYRPIGQRGDPLKIIVYRVFIDIARENEPTVPCTCWVRAVAVLSAISAKLNFFQALCIATASGGLQSHHTEIQTCTIVVFPYTGIQGYRDTGIPGYRDTGIHGYGDTGIRGYSDTGIQGHMIP